MNSDPTHRADTDTADHAPSDTHCADTDTADHAPSDTHCADTGPAHHAPSDTHCADTDTRNDQSEDRGDRSEARYIQPEGVLLLAATPIGHILDASQRFIHAFVDADVVAAEDTRRAKALAGRLGVRPKGRLLALHDHNEGQKADELLDLVEAGQRVIVVSDAGMPTVSDPGFRLVRRAVERGIRVSSLPGPSAPVTALAISGLPSDRFTFEGFLPRKEGEARAYLRGIAALPHTLIFFESAKRLAQTLERMSDELGPDRRAVVARELTKTYEDLWRGTLSQLTQRARGEVLGEITIVVEGATGHAHADDYVHSVLTLAQEGMRLKDAAAQVAEATGLRKNELFKAALEVMNAERR